MIKEFEFFHGVVFARILHYAGESVSIKPYPTQDNSSYVINDRVGIYIKYSSKRLTPWRFSFLKRHQDEITEMKNKFEEVFLLLVCNNDGVVVLSFKELSIILNDVHEEIEWVSVVRNKREMYTVRGSDGELKFKIGRNEFPHKILEASNKNTKSIIKNWFGK